MLTGSKNRIVPVCKQFEHIIKGKNIVNNIKKNLETVNCIQSASTTRTHTRFVRLHDELAIYTAYVFPTDFSEKQYETIGKYYEHQECIYAFIDIFQLIVPYVTEAASMILDFATTEIIKYSDCASVIINILDHDCMMAINLKNTEYHVLMHSDKFDKDLSLCGSEYVYWSLVSCKHDTRNYCFHKKFTGRMPRHFVEDCFEIPPLSTFQIEREHQGEFFTGCLIGFAQSEYKFLIITDSCTYVTGVTNFKDILFNYMYGRCCGLSCHYSLESLEYFNPDLEGVVHELYMFKKLDPKTTAVLYSP
jgi:hypothetical protein